MNVFIDGVSYKNDVIDGGVVGQDASRGTRSRRRRAGVPGPDAELQGRVREGGSAIITAITKSGGNRYSGEIFNFYQDKGLVENEAIVRDA